MGRYYSGDIEGKFWFAVQSSGDPAFFGLDSIEPEVTTYYGNKDDHLEAVQHAVDDCCTKLHTTRENFLKFKEENEYIKVEKMIEEKVIKDIGTKDTQVWLARLDLGLKIEKCIEDTGECEFDAEH